MARKIHIISLGNSAEVEKQIEKAVQEVQFGPIRIELDFLCEYDSEGRTLRWYRGHQQSGMPRGTQQFVYLEEVLWGGWDHRGSEVSFRTKKLKCKNATREHTYYIDVDPKIPKSNTVIATWTVKPAISIVKVEVVLYTVGNMSDPNAKLTTKYNVWVRHMGAHLWDIKMIKHQSAELIDNKFYIKGGTDLINADNTAEVIAALIK